MITRELKCYSVREYGSNCKACNNEKMCLTLQQSWSRIFSILDLTTIAIVTPMNISFAGQNVRSFHFENGADSS